MITFVLGAIVGAVIFGLVIRNNPALAKKLGLIVDKLESQLENKTNKKK